MYCRKSILFFFLVTGLVSCNSDGSRVTINPPTGMQDTLHIIKEFKGLYSDDGTNKTFISCDDPGRVHLIENKTHQIDTLYKSILPNAYPGEAVYMELRAEITPSPDPDFSDLLIAKEFLKAEQKNQKNSCIPSDYWCLGTEPFWSIQISEKENLIDFYNPMEQRTTHFKYSKPEINNGITTYSSGDEKSKSGIRIVIKKESCDGAIDQVYEYSALVELNGRAFSGCAIKP